jgi:hypothetical protein
MIDTNILYYKQIYIVYMGIGTYIIIMVNSINNYFGFFKTELEKNNFNSINQDSLLFPISESIPQDSGIPRKTLSKIKSCKSLTEFVDIEIVDNYKNYHTIDPTFQAQYLSNCASFDNNFYLRNKIDICFLCNTNIVINSSMPTYCAYDNTICKKCYIFLDTKFSN